jgi:hypothetical protein
VIEQPARGRDDDLRTAAQRANLRLEPDAAVDRGRADAPLRSVGSDALLDLEGELAGRSEHQAADREAGRAAWPAVADGQVTRLGPACVEDLEDRQHERRRLAGPRLGAGQHVPASEDEWDGLRLHGRGLCIALGRDGTKELGRQPEMIERHGRDAPEWARPRGVVRGDRSGQEGGSGSDGGEPGR